ncbi:hypothetical protein ACP4OV_003999 [Aristida adscensionis]
MGFSSEPDILRQDKKQHLQEQERAMAHPNRTTGSLPVPNVQALAESCIRSGEPIPERYIRVEVGTEDVISGNDSTSAIPVIDLSKLCNPQPSQEERAKLGSACRQWGIFQLINHGVPEEVIRDLKKDIAEFFALPFEAKKAYSMPPNRLEGYGQAFVVSEEQNLDWADMFALIVRPIESRDMSFWPAHPTSFKRNSIDKYSTETARLARRLFELMAEDMGVEPESLLGVFRGQPQGLRMNYYPACRQAGRVLGLSPHTDAAGLTLQLQVNDVPGLQVRRDDGGWLAVDVPDGALLVIVGDILEVTDTDDLLAHNCMALDGCDPENGKYRCVVHRAVVHPSRERISAAVFHRPCQEAVLGPLPELVEDAGGEARYRSIAYVDYIKRYFSAKLDGRSHIESLRIDT